METKQTAVEWLIEQLTNRQNGIINALSHLSLDKIYNQSKEKEKQQIIDADLNGSVRTAKAIDYRITQLKIKELAEQYYNETFNK